MTLPIARIKKLLRLSRSPEPHEAASARAEADRLMRQHGVRVTLDAERVTVVVDQQPDDFRALLARDIAASRGCRATKNNYGWVAFQGARPSVDSARRLYEHLTAFGREACEGGLRWWSMRDADEFARARFWTGFVVTLSARLPVAERAAASEQESAQTHAQAYEPAPDPAPGGGDEEWEPAEDDGVMFTVTASGEGASNGAAAPRPAPAPVTLKERSQATLAKLARNPNAGGIMAGIEFNAFAAGRNAALGVSIEAWGGKEAESGKDAPVEIRGQLTAGRS